VRTRLPRDERGVTLVIMVLVMTLVLGVAALRGGRAQYELRGVERSRYRPVDDAWNGAIGSDANAS